VDYSEASYVPSLDGVKIWLTQTTGTQLRVVLRDDSVGKWCAPYPQDGSQLVLWEEFNTDCDLTSSGAAYSGEPVVSLTVEQPSTDAGDIPYDFCLDDMRDVATAYYTSGDWYGYVVTKADGEASIFSDNLRYKQNNTNFCFSGNVPSSPADSAILGAYLAQSLTPGRTTPGGLVSPVNDSLEVAYSNTYATPLEVVLSDGTNEWCAPLLGSATETILWSTFTKCTDSMVFYAGEPLQAIGLRVPSDGGLFDVCLNGLSDVVNN
jgi:hypothetical protein